MAAYVGWGSFGQELFQGSWAHPRPKAGWEAEDKWLREHLGQAQWESAQRSIINAHYTDPPTVQAMWRMVERMGFKGGRVLEPSMGIGNFFGLMPLALAAKSDLTGIELDSITGQMAKLLYPRANISIKGYQDSKTPDGFYDLAIGNWPFAADGPADRRYDKINPTLHDYFFLKAIDQVRAGGLVVGITSAGTMDKAGKAARARMSDQADLVAAFRLPTGAFEKYAGTKVVTDIIILQKREPGTAMSEATQTWLDASEMQFEGGDVRVSNYYALNPQNVLGRMDFGHGTTTFRPGLIVHRPDNLLERLEALHEQLPEGIYKQAVRKKEPRFIINNTTQRQNAIVVGPDGNLYQVQGERLAALTDVARGLAVKDAKKAAGRAEQVRKLVGIREAYAALIDAERAGAENTEALRKALNDQYQAFRKAHGTIQGSDGHAIFDAVKDPFAPALAALERPDGSPSMILTEAVTRSGRMGKNPTIPEAYVMMRNEGISVDLERAAEIAKKPVETVEKSLLDSKAIYRTPGEGFEASDVYLSGNVRLKLREAQEAVARGEPLEGSVKALEAVQPKDVPYFQIEAKLGGTWISNDHYRAFVKDMLGLTDDEAEGVNIRFKRGRWQVIINPSRLIARAEATTIRGVPHYPFHRLLEAAMSNRPVTIRYKDQDGNMVVDAGATEATNTKIAELREEFSVWAWRDPERRVSLERAYNETMNNTARPQFDGSFLDMSGMVLRRGEDPFSLRQHQMNAIWRGVAQGRGLFAHEVGTGKTYTMGGVAVEGRRFGVHRKPVVFAHNANSSAVAREMQEMYPGGKFLYIDNLAPAQIKATLYRIANEDWDAVIMPHSLIDKIALKRETLMDLAREQIQELEEEAHAAAEADDVEITDDMWHDENELGKLRSVTAKNLVKQRMAIMKKIDQMAARASEEGAIPFEDLGADAIIVDEAHEFKKPPIATRMKVKGLNTGTSNRSIALSLLTGYVRKQRGGKGVYLFTGTPITNSLVEIFNMMRYVMQDRMADAGIEDWDSWFNTFADALTDVELSASGDYENTTRLSAFVNTDELVRVASEFTDVVLASDMPEFLPRSTKNGKTLLATDLTESERKELTDGRTENPEGRPYKKIVTDVADMSLAQKMIFEHLKQMAADFRSAGGKQRYDWMRAGDERSPVIVETNAANTSLDARLYDATAPDHPASKVNRAVANIMRHYNEHPKATQAVFVDRGYDKPKAWDGIADPPAPLVQDMVNKLVAAGIPKGEIVIVAGGTSAERKKQIADAMNAATVRVVIGQSGTLGVGVNMQVNLRAMHHLDAPWRPGDLEQRNGRGERQGNKWNTVLEYRYITEGIDGRRWQVLSAKDRFIKQFIRAFNDDSGKRLGALEGDAADINDEGGDILETLAKAAGDARVQRRAKIKSDIDRLQRRERQHTFGIADAIDRTKKLREDVKRLRQWNANWTPAMERWEAARARAAKAAEAAKDKRVWNEAEIGGRKLWVNEDIATALEAEFKKSKRGQTVVLGTFNGLRIVSDWASNPKLDLPSVFLEPKDGVRGYDLESVTPTAILGAAAWARRNLVGLREDADKMDASIKRLEAAAKADFPQQAKLDKARLDLAALEADLAQNPIPPPSWLRNGAMIDTAIWVDGDERTVVGHRVRDTYYVLTEEGAVPYLDAKDANGQPVFEEREPPPQVQQGSQAQQPPPPPAPKPDDDDARYAAGWDAVDTGADQQAPSAEAIKAIAEAVQAVTGGRITVRFVRDAFAPTWAGKTAPASAGGLAYGPLVVAALNPRVAWNLHHESVHALRNLGVIEPKEWEVLRAAAAKGGWLKEFSILERYRALDAEKQDEEAIAEKFGQWSTVGTPEPKGRVGRTWNRVKRFVERTGNALRGRGFLAAEDVFERIASGKVGQRATGSAAPTRGPATADEALARLAMFDNWDFGTTEDLPAFLEGVRFAVAPAPAPGRPAATFQSPPASGMADDIIHSLQDRFIDLKRTQAEIEKARGSIPDVANPYQKEELYHGRVAKRIKDFLNDEVRPLIEAVQQSGIPVARFEQFLWARHAEERNDRIASINPEMPDGGSGMTTAAAQAYLAAIDPAERRTLDRLAGLVDDITRGTRETWLDYEIEGQDAVTRMEDAYEHYVPLQREEMEGAGRQGDGQGFDTRGSPAARAMGSDRSVVHILANAIAQRESAIVRGEKNIVANAVLQLARQNPNPDFWSVALPPMKKVMDRQTGMVIRVVDHNYRSRPDVLTARRLGPKGEIIETSLVFREQDPRAKRMAMALKNLDIDHLNKALGHLAVATRMMARLNTQYNPVFGIKNLIRDTFEGNINLTSTPIATRQAEVVAAIGPAMKAIYRSLRRERRGRQQAPDTWTQEWEEFQRAGGTTGYRTMFDTSEKRTEEIDGEIRRLSEGKSKRLAMAPLRFFRDWISDYNETLENSVRLAVYKAAKNAGLSRDRSASIAKNITVNFNRKGSETTTLQAFFAFFNPAVQGPARMATTLAGKAGKYIIAAGIALGAAQQFTIEAAGFKENEIPSYVLENNLVIPTGGKSYAMIPLPLGYKMLPAIGRVGTELAMSGGKKAGPKLMDLAGTIAGSFNPLGSGGFSGQTFAPTVLDPVVAVMENRSWTGGTIARQDMSSLDPTPGFTRGRAGATGISTEIARWINHLTFGTADVPGKWSPTPDQIDYLAAQYAGGAAREMVIKPAQIASSLMRGEEVPVNRVPLVGSFVGTASGRRAVEAVFFDHIKEVNGHERTLKGMRARRENPRAYVLANPEANPALGLVAASNKAEKDIAEIRKRLKEAREANKPLEIIQRLEARMETIMRGFNTAYERAKERTTAR